MTHLIAIAGSPVLDSKSTQLLQTALVSTKQQDFTGKLFSVRDAPAHDLFYGAGEDNPDLNKIIDQPEQSSGFIIATYLQSRLFRGAKSLIGFAVAKSPGGKSRIVDHDRRVSKTLARD